MVGSSRRSVAARSAANRRSEAARIEFAKPKEKPMRKTSHVRTPLATTALVAVALSILAGAALLCSSGCAAKTEDYGWFSYAAPEGWQSLNMSEDATSIAFLPDQAVRETGVYNIEIRQVDWLKQIPQGEFATACIGDLKQQWEYDCEQAELQGKPLPPFECNEISSMIGGPGKIEAFSVQLVRNGRALRFLTHYIEMPDGRRFIVEYTGSDPGYTENLEAITGSLKTMRFADAQ
jgi:hypothetical protein